MSTSTNTLVETMMGQAEQTNPLQIERIGLDQMSLTDAEVAALRAVRLGADVHSDQLYFLLEGLAVIGLVQIVPAMAPDKRLPGFSDGPWCGAIATAVGKRELTRALRVRRQTKAAARASATP
jgi:hypothetical protein